MTKTNPDRRKFLRNAGLTALASAGAVSFPWGSEAQQGGHRGGGQFPGDMKIVLDLLRQQRIESKEDADRFGTAGFTGDISRSDLETNPFVAFLDAPTDAINLHIGDIYELVRGFGGTIRVRKNGNPPSFTLFGWRFQLERVEDQPLPECVVKPITHYKLNVLRQRRNGSFKWVLQVILGAYRNRDGTVCFVLQETVHSHICQKICSPKRLDLAQVFRWVLALAAVVLGVRIFGWIITLFAVLAAIFYFPYLLGIVSE